MQIDPAKHPIMDTALYKDRDVWVNKRDSDGQIVKDDDTGQEVMQHTTEKITRITHAMQKDIVNWAVKMCTGESIEYKPVNAELNDVEQKFFDMVVKTIKDNKFEYLDAEILRQVCTYKIAAEVWFSEECEPEFWEEQGSKANWKLRVIVMSQETGDLLYPIKDEMGKMFALGRSYKVLDDDDKAVERFDIFSNVARYTYGQSGGQWEWIDVVENKYKKANFVVYEQDKEEWADVQPAIERVEVRDSRVSDSNDVIGSPMIAISGKVEGFGRHGDGVKIFELENGAKIDVVEANQAPDAIKMERDNLVKSIYQYTSTPHVTIDDAAGFGANMPGITIKMLFLPATLKAMNRHTGTWGMSIQRRINFISHVMPLINPSVASAKRLEIKAQHKIFLPQNETEEFENIVKLYNAGLLSKEKAVAKLSLVEDVDAEIKLLDAAAKAKIPATPTLIPATL